MKITKVWQHYGVGNAKTYVSNSLSKCKKYCMAKFLVWKIRSVPQEILVGMKINT